MIRGRLHGPGLPSTEQLLKPWLHHLQVIRLDLLRKALDVQDGLVSLVEQLLADLLLHPVSPGAQLREALEHIQAGSNRLRIGIRLPLTCTSLLFCACFHFAIVDFLMNIHFSFYRGIYSHFPSAVFMLLLFFSLQLLPA